MESENIKIGDFKSTKFSGIFFHLHLGLFNFNSIAIPNCPERWKVIFLKSVANTLEGNKYSLNIYLFEY